MERQRSPARRTARIGGLLLTLAPAIVLSCTRGPIYVPLPPNEGAVMTLVLAESGSSPRLFAYPPAEARAESVTLSEDEAPARFLGLTFSSTRSELEGAAGELTLAAEGEGVALPRSDHAYRIEVQASGAGSWTEIDPEARPELRLSLPVPPSRCAKFDRENRALDTVSFPLFAVGLEDHVALIGLADGTLVRTSRTSTRVEPVANPTSEMFSAATVDAQTGTLWLAAWSGQIYSGPARTPLQLAAETMPRVPGPRVIATGIGSAGPEAFVVDEGGQVLHVTRQRVTHHHTFDRSRSAFWNLGVARRGDGAAIAVSIASPDVVLIEAGGATLEQPNAAEVVSYGAAWHSPELGDVVVSSRGRVYVRGAGSWRELAHTEAGFDLFAIVPYEAGFVVAGRIGVVDQYRMDEGMCPFLISTQQPVGWIVAFGQDLLMVHQSQESLNRFLLTLFRRR